MKIWRCYLQSPETSHPSLGYLFIGQGRGQKDKHAQVVVNRGHPSKDAGTFGDELTKKLFEPFVVPTVKL